MKSGLSSAVGPMDHSLGFFIINVYIHMYLYRYIYLCVCVCIYTCVCIEIHIYRYIYRCVHAEVQSPDRGSGAVNAFEELPL